MKCLIYILTASWALVASGGSLSAADKAPARPNILFILADDQRWDTIRAVGNREIITPNLDRLVERGFHFTNAYCMGGMISAVCWPSRAMLITGRSLWRIPSDTNLRVAPPGVPLLPKVLAQASYVTFRCGKGSSSCGFSNTAFATNVEIEGRAALSATEHAERAIEFLRRHDAGRPFFLYLEPPVPHDPRLAPQRFARLYDPVTLSLSKNFLPAHPFDNGALVGRDEGLAPHPRTPEVMRQHLADYYATISHLDDEVGRILQVLDERGLTENTIVIFSSDQGLAVGGRHGLMGKQNLYEHFKSPLVIAGPGIPRGKSDALVYLFDLFPTICDLAGATSPEVVEGQSLLGIIQGQRVTVRDWLFCAYRDCQRMVRDQRWKLIQYNAAGVKNTQLFDLEGDADELNNLAADPRFAAERTRLETLLKRARAQFGDPSDFDRPAARAAASQ
jgi:arylsulfatase A-like enzyme